MKLLAVDAGRSEVEFKYSGGEGAFPSAVAEATEQNNPALVEKDLEIELDEKKWWVGRLAKDEGGNRKVSNFGKSKADEILRIQVIASAIYAGLDGKKIDLGVMLPINLFIPEERKKVRGLLKGAHKFTYSLVEKSKKQPKIKQSSIVINENIVITPEGATAFFADKQSENTQVLDFGAMTLNFAYYKFRNGESTYVNGQSGTHELGWEIIKDDYGFIDKEDDELDPDSIEKMAYAISKKAIDTVSKKQLWSADNITQIFGGVAEQVYPHIKKKFPRAYVPKNPRYGNINGLYTALEEFHAEEEELEHV